MVKLLDYVLLQKIYTFHCIVFITLKCVKMLNFNFIENVFWRVFALVFKYVKKNNNNTVKPR